MQITKNRIVLAFRCSVKLIFAHTSPIFRIRLAEKWEEEHCNCETLIAKLYAFNANANMSLSTVKSAEVQHKMKKVFKYFLKQQTVAKETFAGCKNHEIWKITFHEWHLQYFFTTINFREWAQYIIPRLNETNWENTCWQYILEPATQMPNIK